jgi:hypothetical protein
VLQQQGRQPGGSQRFQVLGIEAGAAGHGEGGEGRIRGKARSAEQATIPRGLADDCGAAGAAGSHGNPQAGSRF